MFDGWSVDGCTGHGVFRVWLAWFALDALPEARREGNGQLRAGRSIGPILGSTPAEIDAGIEHDDFRQQPCGGGSDSEELSPSV